MMYLIEPSPLKTTKPKCSARGDASAILTRAGYNKFYIPRNRTIFDRIKNTPRLVIQAISLYWKLRGGTLFIQWPTKFCPVEKLYRWVISRRCGNLQLLVHDLDYLRGASEKNLERSLKMFRLSNLIILHSVAMKDFVVGRGIDVSKIKVIECFDYLTKDEITRHWIRTKDVVFVGQLDRCSFLDKVTEADLGVHVNLYGRFQKDLGIGITHKGAFRADNVSVFEGSWGLVWGGDTIDECTGDMGNYLRYNSPHKLSLFIAAHLPIIIWDKAAKSEYVKEKGIGICISSLREISKAIDAVTDKEYELMIKNIEKESLKLRSGRQLLACLNIT